MFDLDNTTMLLMQRCVPFGTRCCRWHDVCLSASDVRRSARCDIAISQYHTATNPYFVNMSFPTGTKVSRGVPDFNDISYSELYVKNNILTLYARSSIII